MTTPLPPIRTHHVSPQFIKKLSFLSSQPTHQPLLPQPKLFKLHYNGFLLARAEDKARVGPSFVQKSSQPNPIHQFQDSPSSGECDPLCSVDETSSEEFEATSQPKTDFLKALAIFAATATGAVAINHTWVAANQNLAMALLFGIGYAGIIFEESLAFNKSGVGLLMAVSLWTIRSIGV